MEQQYRVVVVQQLSHGVLLGAEAIVHVISLFLKNLALWRLL